MREPAALEASAAAGGADSSTDLFLLNASGLYQQVMGLVKRHPLSGQDQRGMRVSARPATCRPHRSSRKAKPTSPEAAQPAPRAGPRGLGRGVSV